MNSKIVKVITVLLSAFIILYALVQAFQFFYSPYQAETVFKTTVNNSIMTDGLVIRDESVINQKKQGVVSYQVQNGDKVAQKSVIAKKYVSQQDLYAEEQIESLEREIAILTEAQNKGSTAAATLDSITAQINENYLKLMDTLEQRKFNGLLDYKLKLQELICKKQIIIGKQKDYSVRIAELKKQQQELKNSIKTKPSTIESPNSGYFAQYTDGLESQYRCADAEKLTTGELRSIIDKTSETQLENDRIGKIIESFEWKMAVLLKENQGISVKEGNKVTLIFPSFGNISYSAVVESVGTVDAEGNNVVIFGCNIMDDDVPKMRLEKVEIALSTVTGIQIPKKAVRYENNVMGVYEKTGRKLYFRKIDKLYETDDYIISKEHEDDTKHEYVQQYDDVVIKGKELYDKKPIDG